MEKTLPFTIPAEPVFLHLIVSFLALMAVIIDHAEFPRDTQVIHELFLAYATSLGIDLTFQSFQTELDSLPGKYAASEGGTLLIARTNGQFESHPKSEITSSSSSNVTGFNLNSLDDTSTLANIALGCVALRRSADGWCEMKRLYVLPEARGLQLGDKLVKAILTQARLLRYRGIRLDTLPNMTAAIRLYRKHGFVETGPYYETPLQDTIFLQCEFD